MKKLLPILLLTGSSLATAQAMDPYWVHTWAYLNSPQRGHVAPAASPRPLETTEMPAGAQGDAEAVATHPNRIAMLLIDNGKVVYRKLSRGASSESLLISYSMAKSLTALSVGTAFCAGHIKSLDDKAETYVPRLQGTAFGQSTVRDLLHMASGADASGSHGEPFATFSGDIRLQKVSYDESFAKYGRAKRRLFKDLSPGDEFDYKNLDTGALAAVVSAATGQPFHAWFGKTVAQEAGLANNSAWALDKTGMAIAHAYFFATLDDWGRLGLYALDAYRGDKGECLQTYLKQAVTDRIRITGNSDFRSYGYQFWTPLTGSSDKSFWMLGYGGQRIGIDPEQKKILVVSSLAPDGEPLEFFRRWTRSR